MLGPGKYDAQLESILDELGNPKLAYLFVIDGKFGHGISGKIKQMNRKELRAALKALTLVSSEMINELGRIGASEDN